MVQSLRDRIVSAPLLWTGLLLAAAPAAADGGVTFTDIAAGGASGLVYGRSPSARQATFESILQQPVITFADLSSLPLKPRGAPGVALFDHDGDGDLDIYVTNGPGTANSLFSNQLVETAQTTFVDVGVAAGVDASDQDSQGVCFGDLDNDGDRDLLVLGGNEANRLFENQGDGTFLDITTSSGIGGGNRTSTACSMADFNGDGLLDVAVANAFDWIDQLPYFGQAFAHTEHNQLFLNAGGNVFTDVSAASGLESHAGLAPGSALISWAIGAVDYDLDGDTDILIGDDQTVMPPASQGGQDVGLIRVFQNDGTGQLTDRTFEAGLDRFGAWMGLSFGDLNCDGWLDVFGTNAGDYAVAGAGFQPGEFSSRWFLGQSDGTFSDPGMGALLVSPFGWGTSMVDYDNDGDTDIVFHGGFQMLATVEAGNLGVILQNQDCSASFELDSAALAGSTDHNRRTVHGMAVGDLDDDGFVDIVSVSNFDPAEPISLTPCTTTFGSVFDPFCFSVPTLLPAPGGNFVWSGITYPDGTLAVELNSGGNGNREIAVDLLGTVGLTAEGEVNRDGIGAVVSFFIAQQGRTAMQPVVAGASYGSQDSLRLHFGLGAATSGRLEVFWPGGVRNQLLDVKDGERILFPEIPCDLDDQLQDLAAYTSCLSTALDDLVTGGVLDETARDRFFDSASSIFTDGFESGDVTVWSNAVGGS